MSQRAVHYIDGEWRSSAGTMFTSQNPATGDVVWEGASATESEINEAIDAARKALPKWASTPTEERIEALHRFRQELEFAKEELVEAIAKEVGKPLWESESEVEAMRNKIGISIDAYYHRCAEIMHQGPAATSITRHKPHGVVAVFGPFNFPGHLPNGHIIPALLAGNTVVLKPSEHTPTVAEVMLQCWEKANVPKGIINMVQGARETGRLLAQHKGIDGLFFTGSWQTGKDFLEHFAQHPGKILALEMGGNNPLIIWDAKNLAAAAYLTIQSAYLTSGQRCTCARRLIIPKSDQGDKLIHILQEMIGNIRVAPYHEKPEAFMGPVISKQTATHLLETQEKLKEQGGKAIVEMHHIKRNTGLITPGLMDVTEIKNRSDEEYFGPFLQIIRVDSFDAAIEEANSTEFGLSAGLFSNSEALYTEFRHRIRAGIVNWNMQLTGASSAAPFGGVGKSGNYRPSAYYAADYCAYPVASMETPKLIFPENLSPGLDIERHL